MIDLQGIWNDIEKKYYFKELKEDNYLKRPKERLEIFLLPRIEEAKEAIELRMAMDDELKQYHEVRLSYNFSPS